MAGLIETATENKTDYLADFGRRSLVKLRSSVYPSVY
jgi:hypothetical protein